MVAVGCQCAEGDTHDGVGRRVDQMRNELEVLRVSMLRCTLADPISRRRGITYLRYDAEASRIQVTNPRIECDGPPSQKDICKPTSSEMVSTLPQSPPYSLLPRPFQELALALLSHPFLPLIDRPHTPPCLFFALVEIRPR